MFKKVEALPDFPKLERKILKFWEERGILNRYLKRNEKAKKRFRFLDGPITANNPMGVHHAWGRTYKDFFQRYKNMQGYRQRFQNGFDCQGLWLEVEEERSLGFNSKQDIENFGIANFSKACRRRVEKYSKMQTEQSRRLGMFMDWGNSYYTMFEENNLYIWHFLKECHKRGWLYKGVNSMPWCVRCGTAISQHELSDGGYQRVTHDSVYVKFPLATSNQEPATSLLIWTTTPWTLLANVAVAVNPKLTYVKVKLGTAPEEERTVPSGEETFILAKNRLSVLDQPFKIVEGFKGEKLLGVRYKGPFDELPAQQGVEHKVVAWDEVSESEGTGLVHIAPGAGAEDFELGKRFALSVLAPLDEFGNYLKGYGGFTGRGAGKVNGDVYASLKGKELFYKAEKVTHSYPHCWRCKEEVVFRVTEEWFIKVEEIRPLLKKAAKTVRWIPDFVGKRMQDWLTNMGDWPISRRRYWGLALPFYECSCGELVVVGSKEELRRLAVDPRRVDQFPELHRPWIDEIKIRCPRCGGEVERAPYVGDCWLDAGIVPFSTLRYLEDRKYWEQWFPADLVCEYTAQVKLWFYSLLFMSVTLENQAPYRAVFTDGFVVDEKGEPMHKSKGNALWFDEAVERMGADVMRWLYLRADNAKDFRFGYGIGDEVRRRFLLILWNCFKFFVEYANVDKVDIARIKDVKPENLDILDRWILSRMNSVVGAVTGALDAYNPQAAALAIESFVSDFSTWYIRRSRNRVGPAVPDGEGKIAFYATGYWVLLTLPKLLAPFMPFLSEKMYRGLTPGGESVHLEDWPRVYKEFIDTKLEAQMEFVRKVCELGHAKRKEAGVRVRQPIASLKIKNKKSKVKIGKELKKLILDELNVKGVDWVSGEGEPSVELDIRITAELKAEGEARELVRAIQNLRKEKRCKLDDRIVVATPSWPKEFEDYIKKETLAAEIKEGGGLSIQVKKKRAEVR